LWTARRTAPAEARGECRALIETATFFREVSPMNLIPWRNESLGLSTLRQEMERLFEDFTGDGGRQGMERWAPSMDLSETPEAQVVKAELPGVDPKDVEISVSGDMLTVKGEKKEEKEEKGKTWHRVERNYGSFVRSVRLPSAVDADRITAEARDGVLTITMPKTEKAKTKRIEVKAAK
jgi:HSP20 family protein